MALLAIRPKKISVTEGRPLALRWSFFEQRLRNVVKKHLKKLSCDQIIVVARGGMVPGTIISHITGIRYIDFFQAEKTRTNNPYDYRPLRVIHVPKIEKHKRYLIVEDIIYQGETTERLFKEIKKQGGVVVGILTVVLCREAQVQKLFGNTPLYSLYFCSEDTWIRFPWEEPIKNEEVF